MNNKAWDIDRREYTLGILALDQRSAVSYKVSCSISRKITNSSMRNKWVSLTKLQRKCAT